MATMARSVATKVLLLDNATVPVNPCNAVIVTVEDPAVPATTVTLVGLAEIVKSCTVKVTVAEWERLPLVPVTVTWTS
jgi:hypothetical protein